MSDNFDARAEYGFPPSIDDFFGDVVLSEDDGPEWNYRLWAEAYLGREQFESLESRFGTIPGIDAVAHMDREVFIIRSALDASTLRTLLWTQFLEAANVPPRLARGI